MNNQKSIDRVCEYRGLPKIRKGWPCEVNGKSGRIWGGNSSANLNIKFDDTGHIFNCHPCWKMKIYNKGGILVYDNPELTNPKGEQ